jgi:CBS domain-containing protein
MPTVRQVLAEKGHDVHHIRSDASVLDALKIMADHEIGALVVLDAGHLVGIISERDYARKVALKGRTSPATFVREIMSTSVICASLDQKVEECLALMTAKAVRHLPVLEHKNVVGIVSIGDLVKSIIGDQKFTIDQLEHYIQGDR